MDRALFFTRLVFLLLAFLLSYGLSIPLLIILGGLADMLPGAAGAWVELGAVLAGTALEFFAAGVMFGVLSGLPWRRSALWTVLGMGALTLVSAGGSPLAWASGAGLFGVLRAVAAGAAGAYGCWWLEQRELAPWVDQARAAILGMIGQ